MSTLLFEEFLGRAWVLVFMLAPFLCGVYNAMIARKGILQQPYQHWLGG